MELHRLKQNEVHTLMDWANAEGWNPGLKDAEIYWATDPEGFYGFKVEGELVAAGAIISYGGEFGFMGLFIVKPEYRSQGLGRQLWQLRRDTLISRLKPGAAIGMDGVLAMQPFYEKGGFKIAFRDECHERIGSSFELDPNVSSITEDDMAEILAYDERCFGFSRPRFMKAWMAPETNHNFKYSRNDQLEGFVCIRKAHKGYKLGPLFADNAQVAEELYKACLNAVPGEPVYLHISTAHQEAVAMAKKFDNEYVFECARMYYGTPPSADMSKVFGITSFELG